MNEPVTIGQTMRCTLLVNGRRTGETLPVEVRQIRRHGSTGQIESVRVRCRIPRERYLWVQPQYLTPAA